MSSTRRADVIVPEILAESLPGAFAGMNLLAGTGAVRINTTLRGAKNRVGNTVKVPLFGNIGELQDVPEGGALAPVKLTQSSEDGTVEHSGIAVSIGDWARNAAVDDIYAEARRQIVEAVRRKLDAKLIAAAVASLPAMTHDGYTGASTLNYDLGVEAMGKFGDEAEEGSFVLWGVHSKVKTDLMKVKETTGRPMLVESVQGGLPRFMGVPLMMSDKLAPTSDAPPKYTSLLIKRGALAVWMDPQVEIETDRDILAADTLMAVHIYYVVHRYSRTETGTKPGVALVQSR